MRIVWRRLVTVRMPTENRTGSQQLILTATIIFDAGLPLHYLSVSGPRSQRQELGLAGDSDSDTVFAIKLLPDC
jgi:hypothetical protein